jgi:hypothetical protein
MTLHFSNASALVAPWVVLYGPKHSELSSKRRHQVWQSVASVTLWAGRFATGRDAVLAAADGAGGSFSGTPERSCWGKALCLAAR